MIDAAQIILPSSGKTAIPITVMDKTELAEMLKTSDSRIRTYINAQGFDASPLSFCILPDLSGASDKVLVGAPAKDADPFALASLASRLPAGHYRSRWR